MHTVFMNASKNPIRDQMDVLWMEREYKQYFVLDCSLESEQGLQKEFEACALKIGEQIDIYKEVNNDFNMVVYADYLEMEKLLREPFPEYDSDHWTENAVYEIARSALAHLFATSLYKQLEDHGRLPKDKILLLLEQKKRSRENESDYLTDGLRTRKGDMRIAVLCKLLGLPTEREMMGMAETATDGDALAATLREHAQQNRIVTAGVDWQAIYADQMDLFFEEIAYNKNHVSTACIALEKTVAELYNSDCTHKVLVSPYITDRRSVGVNKALDTKRNLLMQMFMWDCIHSGTVYADPQDDTIPKAVPQLSNDDWQQLVTLLDRKKMALEDKEQETRNLGVEYMTLGLAPPLYRLPNDKFGLDESGNPRKKPKLCNRPADKNKEKEDENQDDNGPERLIDKEEDFTMENVDERKTNWFGSDYTPMDVEGEAYTADVGGRLLSAAEYCRRAEELACHHEDFMSRLSQKVGRVTSNYAGRSETNASALLRKRKVSANDAQRDEGINDYKYTDKHQVPEDDVSDNVIRRAKRSYISMLLGYLEFNAGRAVAMTNIREQVAFFASRVHAIEKSLKILYTILIILAVFLAVLYTPFVLIQWELITKNIGTLLYALLSLAVPYALLITGYVLATIWQKNKMRKAWKELLEKSSEAAEDNKKAVRAYEALLTMHIPSLRWIYEYVLDVEFFRDCNRIAKSKLNHHATYLYKAAEILGNIIEDLEYDSEARYGEAPRLEIDYTQAFCEGSNREVYAIIDKDVETLIKRGGTT